MKKHSQTRLTREGLVYTGLTALVFFGAFVREINLMVMLAGMMLGPLIISWRWALLTVSRLSVQRKVPSGVFAQEELVVELEVINQRKRWASWALELSDTIARVQPTTPQNTSPSIQGEALVGHLPASNKRMVAYRGKLPTRGRYQIGPLKVSTQFPLGLVSRSFKIDTFDHITVYPRLGKLQTGWNQLYQQALLGKSQTHQFGHLGQDFHSLREWRPGDNKRWIHWRTSARRGNLMVRQFEQPKAQEFAVLLDLAPSFLTQSEASAELVLSFAATIASDLCQRGSAQLLFAWGGEPENVIEGLASPALLQQFLEKLAVAELPETDQLSQLLAVALPRIRPGMGLVLISSRNLTTSQLVIGPSSTPGSRQRIQTLIATAKILSPHQEDFAHYFLLPE